MSDTGHVTRTLELVSEIREIVLKIERKIEVTELSTMIERILEIEKLIKSLEISKEKKPTPTYRAPVEWDLTDFFKKDKQKSLPNKQKG